MNHGYWRLSPKLARQIDRPNLKGQAVAVHFMSDETKEAEGIDQSVVMAETMHHDGELIAVNVVLNIGR